MMNRGRQGSETAMRVFNDTANNIVLVISIEHNYQRFYKTDKNGGMQIPVYVVSGRRR